MPSMPASEAQFWRIQIGSSLRISIRRASTSACGRFGCLRVFLANLLLDEGAADELFESTLARKSSLADAGRIENRKLNLLVNIAGQNGVVVDHSDHAVQNHRLRRLCRPHP